jgi:uncharacterized protein (DUF3820 family)
MPATSKQWESVQTQKKDAKRKLKKFIKKHPDTMATREKLLEKCGNKNPLFGKFKDTKWKDVPNYYIQWCVRKKIWFDPTMAQYIQLRLDEAARSSL